VHRADVGRDRHLVVVEHDDDVAVGVPGVVEPFVRQAAGERPVADDGRDLEVLAAQVATGGHADAAEIAVAAWPAPNVSYSLSVRLRKPLSPFSWRSVSMDRCGR
jgi:hypothetical protein